MKNTKKCGEMHERDMHFTPMFHNDNGDDIKSVAKITLVPVS